MCPACEQQTFNKKATGLDFSMAQSPHTESCNSKGRNVLFGVFLPKHGFSSASRIRQFIDSNTKVGDLQELH